MLNTALLVILFLFSGFGINLLVDAGIPLPFVLFILVLIYIALWVTEPEHVDKQDAIPVYIVDNNLVNPITISGGDS